VVALDHHAPGEREARFQAWQRLVESIFGGQTPPNRRDLTLLSSAFKAGEYSAPIFTASSFRISRVDSEGRIEFEIDLQDDATSNASTKKNLPIEFLDDARFRLNLPRTNGSDLVLRPVDLRD
jgi:hypothetical protein